MFDRTYYATHPDMMECVSNEELRERYLIQDLYREGECVLNYTHADRFVIGGVAVGGAPVKLPAQTEPPSAVGHAFLERRELAIVNVGVVEGTVEVDAAALKKHAAVPKGQPYKPEILEGVQRSEEHTSELQSQ